MRVMFVHQNFPGQYKHLAAELARSTQNDVRAIAVNKLPSPPGVRVSHYPVRFEKSQAHPLAMEFERKVIWAEAAARRAEALKRDGFSPDIIIGHPGWGEMLFLPDVWPDARILSFMEFYYRSDTDFTFERGPLSNPAEYWKIRARNAPFLLSIEASDWCVTPTQWQWQQLPGFARRITSVIHDGIDTQLLKPSPDAMLSLGRVREPCRVGDEVVTFVNRNLEPYRGFHIFLKAIPEILKHRPKARIIIVGGTGVSYGAPPGEGQTWRAKLVEQMQEQLDFSRIHFVGKVPYNVFISLLQISAAHVYLTYPFVLSWSMLEAMSAECLVIGSRTGPVTEVIQHEKNGLLVEFSSHEEIARAVIDALATPEKYRDIRRAARNTVLEKYELRSCLSQHLRLIEAVVAGRQPDSTVTESFHKLQELEQADFPAA